MADQAKFATLLATAFDQSPLTTGDFFESATHGDLPGKGRGLYPVRPGSRQIAWAGCECFVEVLPPRRYRRRDKPAVKTPSATSQPCTKNSATRKTVNKMKPRLIPQNISKVSNTVWRSRSRSSSSSATKRSRRVCTMELTSAAASFNEWMKPGAWSSPGWLPRSVIGGRYLLRIKSPITSPTLAAIPTAFHGFSRT